MDLRNRSEVRPCEVQQGWPLEPEADSWRTVHTAPPPPATTSGSCFAKASCSRRGDTSTRCG